MRWHRLPDATFATRPPGIRSLEGVASSPGNAPGHETPLMGTATAFGSALAAACTGALRWFFPTATTVAHWWNSSPGFTAGVDSLRLSASPAEVD